MAPRPGRATRLLSLLLLTAAGLFPVGPGVSPLHAQSPVYSDEHLLEVAREIIGAAGYGGLATVDGNDRPRVRVMDPFPPEPGMVIWFATNPRTRKVDEIRANPAVAVYYFDPETLGYVTISGTARLVDDPEEKALRWKKGWEAFYPNRKEDYLLIEVTPKWLEVVSIEHGIEGPTDDWRPPRVEFEEGVRRGGT